MLPGPRGMGAGYGSTMYYRTAAMSHAIESGKPYMFYGHFNYARNSHCKEHGQYGNFECYFEALTSCDKRMAALRHSYHAPGIKQSGGDCMLSRTKCHGPPADSSFDHTPKKFAGKGMYWNRMMQLWYMNRVNNATRGEMALDNLKSRIGYEHPIIGLHVRHGDGCLHGMRKSHGCKALSSYLRELRVLKAMYGVRRVFLATDSAEIANQTQEFKHEFDFIMLDWDRSPMSTGMKIERRMESPKVFNIDQHNIMIDSLRDLWLLAEADYLVTHQASTLSRLALQFSTFLHKHIPPFISLDGPWCFHWRMCCDVQGDGKQKTC